MMKSSMRSALLILCGLLSGVIFDSCIKNDLPYPRIEEYIKRLAAEGQVRDALIDSVNFKATVYLDETTDISKVRFREFEVSNNSEPSPNLLEGTYNLSSPLVVRLTRFQTYDWIITAEQTIERYFTIAGQVGETTIDPVGHRIVIYMPESANLARLTLTSIKLGPAGITTLSPDIQPGPIDLSAPLRIDVTAWNRSVTWTVYVEKVESNVQTTQVDAWSQVAWAYGSCTEGMTGGFQYSDDGGTYWHDVPEADITQNGGVFSGRISHLVPLRKYLVRATATGAEGLMEYANQVEVTMQSTEILPDGSFDQWWQDGRVWCPWNEFGVQFWDTGNTGAATLGQSNVQPSDDTPSGTGRSAKLETKFVGIAGIGKLAAGSIYTGKFAKVDGTNGILDFGRPWEVRPTKLRGYFKYTTAPINYASSEYKYLLDRPDSCHIYVAMTDWTEPYQIRTNPATRHLFDPSSPEIIAYGEMILGSDTPGWQEFEIELKYRSTSRVPRYLQITCAASKYGDFFTGGAGAVLYVDDFELLYDY